MGVPPIAAASYLAEVVGGCATHVVVYSRQHWNRLSSYVNSSKDHRRFRDSWKPGMKLLRRQVCHRQVDVVVLLANTSEIRYCTLITV